nr:hypothetical protein [uncultured Rhodopila sp.]
MRPSPADARREAQALREQAARLIREARRLEAMTQPRNPNKTPPINGQLIRPADGPPPPRDEAEQEKADRKRRWNGSLAKRVDQDDETS